MIHLGAHSGYHGSRHAARVKTYGEVLREYEFHPESKCADKDGNPSGKQTMGLFVSNALIFAAVVPAIPTYTFFKVQNRCDFCSTAQGTLHFVKELYRFLALACSRQEHAERTRQNSWEISAHYFLSVAQARSSQLL